MTPSALNGQEKREFASEIKFLIDPSMADRVRAWARQHLERDPNARDDTYGVTSLYYDTEDFTIYRREGYYRHSKFRIRCYDGATLFLERKLKASGLVAKQRTKIATPELEQLMGPVQPGWTGAWFQNKTLARRMRPVCQVDYFRTARVLMTTSGPIRLTLDERLRALPAQEPRFADSAAAKPLTDRVVLELKFRRDLPHLFRELVAGCALNPLSFSKYRNAVQTLGLGPDATSAADATTGVVTAPRIAACPNS